MTDADIVALHAEITMWTKYLKRLFQEKFLDISRLLQQHGVSLEELCVQSRNYRAEGFRERFVGVIPLQRDPPAVVVPIEYTVESYVLLDMIFNGEYFNTKCLEKFSLLEIMSNVESDKHRIRWCDLTNGKERRIPLSQVRWFYPSK